MERNQAVVQAARRHPGWIALKIAIFVAAVLIVAFAALAIVPNAQITLVPQSTKITASINVFADLEAKEADALTGHERRVWTSGVETSPATRPARR